MSSIRDAVRDWIPPALLRLSRKMRGLPIPPAQKELVSYQGVTTIHAMRALHQGKFAEIYDRYYPLNPHNPPNETRLRHYICCLFASQAAHLPGDFVAAGISYGVAPHVIYDFVGFEGLGKTYHFIDPFIGILSDNRVYANYNQDIELVRRQYPASAPIKYHRELLPQCFPLPGIDSFAFVHLNVSNAMAESSSLPYLYDKLSPGGAIIIDNYAFNKGNFEPYDRTPHLGDKIWTMVTGQGVLLKPYVR